MERWLSQMNHPLPDRPWRPGDYMDRLPEHRFTLVEEPDINLPEWVEPVIWTAVIAIALVILLVAGWMYLNSTIPAVSR